MELLVYSLLFVTLTVLFSLIFGALARKRLQLNSRMATLQQLHPSEEARDEFELPFAERIINPSYQAFLEFLGRLTPQGVKDSYQKAIVQAGLTKEFTPLRIVGLQVLVTALAIALMILLLTQARSGAQPLLFILVALIVFYMPYSYIKGKAATRKRLVEKSLPDMLDLLYISVEAGLGFDAAIKKTAEKMTGPLSDEILRAIEDISKGRERIPALRSIGERTEVEDVRNFITAVIQSELLGSNIASMLRTQSRVMRERRRQRAEEKAQKLPVKMLFPLVFLMFPALFVIILGPAVLQLVEMFL